MLHDLSARGWRVIIVAVTDGEAAYGRDDSELVQRLRRVRPLEQSRAVFRLARRADIIRVGIPDGAVAACSEALRMALAPIVRSASLLATTWRRDGHPDHEATGRVAARVASDFGVSLTEFPIWAWQWARPADLPVGQLRTWHMSEDALLAKPRALRAFTSQIAPFNRLPVLPKHVVARFLRPVEAFFV
jgi:LmbE family N-acetylglucosaminyl deacetylase